MPGSTFHSLNFPSLNRIVNMIPMHREDEWTQNWNFHSKQFLVRQDAQILDLSFHSSQRIVTPSNQAKVLEKQLIYIQFFTFLSKTDISEADTTLSEADTTFSKDILRVKRVISLILGKSLGKPAILYTFFHIFQQNRYFRGRYHFF